MHYARRLLNACTLALCALPLATGCIFVAQPAPGDLTFLWSFAGEGDCAAARVAEVDVYVTNSGGDTIRELTRVECAGGGLTIEDFSAGEYTVAIEAYSLRGRLLYSGEEDVTITAGEVTDMGVIELDRAGAADTGDVAFYWSFDGEPTCEAAGVDEIDVEVIDAGGATILESTEDCYGGGLVLEDLEPGAVTVYVDAFTSDDTYLFAGSAETTVVAGETADLGTLELEPVDPMEEDGTLRIDFGFLYPASAAETDCARAGVDEVDLVFIDEPGGEMVDGYTIACDGDGIGVDVPLPPGQHTFYLQAYGTYGGDFILLYDTADLQADVVSEEITDLALVEMERVSSNFADLLIEPTLPDGETCASLGLTDMSYTVTRLVDGELVDDDGMFDCTDGSLLRQTFVPGSYRIDITATGDDGDYVGTATVNAAPDEQADAAVEIVLQS